MIRRKNCAMTGNMENLDRILRIVIGVILPVLAFGGTLATGWMHWAAIIAGIVMLMTMAIGDCPAYSIRGMRICNR